MSQKLMIRQGYVPSTCTLDDDSVGSATILAEVRDGRDPCAGCNMDRSICHGRSNTVNVDRMLMLLDRREQLRLDDIRENVEFDAKAKEEGIKMPWESL